VLWALPCALPPQTAFLTLDEAIKTTNRRVNALEHVVKPRLENTIAYIKVGAGRGGPQRHTDSGGAAATIGSVGCDRDSC
jgi:hypothetical protein